MREMPSLHSRKLTNKKYSHLMSKNTDQTLVMMSLEDKILFNKHIRLTHKSNKINSNIEVRAMFYFIFYTRYLHTIPEDEHPCFSLDWPSSWNSGRTESNSKAHLKRKPEFV